MGGFLVVVTAWSLAWTLTSVASIMCLLAAHLSPSWLLGQPKDIDLNDFVIPTTTAIEEELTAWEGMVSVRPTLGLWLRCTVLRQSGRQMVHCGVFATSVPDLPATHVLSLMGLVGGTAFAVLTCTATLVTACFRTLFHKSLYTITGAVQAFAGALCVFGLLVFPLTWNSTRVQILCGPTASEFNPGQCSVGWALYTAGCGTLLILVCAFLAVMADKSTSSGKVEAHIQKGSTLICLL